MERIHTIHTDSVTFLSGSSDLIERVESINRNEKKGYSVLFVFAERFRTINNALGCEVGDSVSKVISNTLRDNFKYSNSTIARIGSDEYAIVLSGVSDLEEQASGLHDSLLEEIQVGHHKLHIKPCIGICSYPSDCTDSTAILRYATIAAYQARKHRVAIQRFDVGMVEKKCRRLSLEAELYKALENNELILNYQPQVRARDSSVVGVEALVRWVHPQRGIVSPLEFIPVAEETGLIFDIGQWVISQAAADAVRCSEAGHPLKFSANVSLLQMENPFFADTVISTIERAGCPVELFGIELTESTICGEHISVQRILCEIAEAGFAISIDDFGTGYSNLANLNRYPIDYLKIDRSIISDNKHATMTASIINLGHSMNMKVVAEGVETAQQVAFLHSQGCDYMQGFHFSKPKNYEDLLEYLQSDHEYSALKVI